jgi:biopolymer transport protein ExbB
MFDFLHTLAVAPSASSPAGLVATVWELAWKGGIIMIPILIASLAALAIALERAIVLSRRRVAPDALLDRVLGAASSPQQAIAACHAQPSPLGRVLAAGLSAWHLDRTEIEPRLVDAGLREAAAMRGRLRALGFIVGVAPMLGLLGTIFGMITAFRTVAASPDALGRTELLAGGIYEALVTTAAGLLVAIPVMLLHQILYARADRRIAEIDAACRALLDCHPSLASSSGALSTAPSMTDEAPSVAPQTSSRHNQELPHAARPVATA